MVVMVVSIVMVVIMVVVLLVVVGSWCRNFVTSDVFKYAPCEKF